MKVQKATRIGIVVADTTLRAAQRVEGRLVTAQVAIGKDFKKSLRQLLTSSPFVGKEVSIGIEGGSVLIESLVMPAGATRSAQAVCAERLKGDNTFNEQSAVLGVAVANAPSGSGPSLVILAAVNRERISGIMAACRELMLNVQAVEAAALATWRGWSGSGLQVRLLRSEDTDIVVAGNDSRLLFCRIVDTPIATVELRATISRAASLLGTEGFDCLTANGVGEDALAQMQEDLGLPVVAPKEVLPDPAAVGLATEGSALADFTPEEDRLLRLKRKTRRVSFTMTAAVLGVVLGAGILSWQEISNLQDRKGELESARHLREQAELQLAGLQSELIEVQNTAKLLTEALPGHRMSRLFEIVVNATPERLLIETASVADRDDTSAGKDSRRRVLDIELGGLAGDGQTVLDFEERLVRTGAFTDVRVEASERVILGPGTEGERYRIYARAETR